MLPVGWNLFTTTTESPTPTSGNLPRTVDLAIARKMYLEPFRELFINKFKFINKIY